MSGTFGQPDFIKSKEEFVNKVIGFWATQHNNFILVTPDSHIDKAEALYDIYQSYWEAIQKGCLNQKGRASVLSVIGKKGCIKAAKAQLEASIDVDCLSA